jgi:hypothetical protein
MMWWIWFILLFCGLIGVVWWNSSSSPSSIHMEVDVLNVHPFEVFLPEIDEVPINHHMSILCIHMKDPAANGIYQRGSKVDTSSWSPGDRVRIRSGFRYGGKEFEWHPPQWIQVGQMQNVNHRTKGVDYAEENMFLIHEEVFDASDVGIPHRIPLDASLFQSPGSTCLISWNHEFASYRWKHGTFQLTEPTAWTQDLKIKPNEVFFTPRDHKTTLKLFYVVNPIDTAQ